MVTAVFFRIFGLIVGLLSARLMPGQTVVGSAIDFGDVFRYRLEWPCSAFCLLVTSSSVVRP